MSVTPCPVCLSPIGYGTFAYGVDLMDFGTDPDAWNAAVERGEASGCTWELPDQCLGWLNGVDFACCGHGKTGFEADGPYVAFTGNRCRWDGGPGCGRMTVYGSMALRWFASSGVGPTGR